MSKWYEVTVSVHRTYAIEVKDDQCESDVKESLLGLMARDDYTIEDIDGPVSAKDSGAMRLLAHDTLYLPDE